MQKTAMTVLNLQIQVFTFYSENLMIKINYSTYQFFVFIRWHVSPPLLCPALRHRNAPQKFSAHSARDNQISLIFKFLIQVTHYAVGFGFRNTKHLFYFSH